ncbi:MAG: polysaccharide biosynthesis/export family protein [Paracoccaceae bacterium]
MNISTSRWAKSVAFFVLVALVASCGLPRSGPNKREIFAGSVQKEGDAFIITVNDRVTRATAVEEALGFADSFLNASRLGSDTIRPGDVLSLRIYENVDDGLLSSEGVNFSTLDTVQVDGAGFIFVPYAGRIKAAGNTPEAIRRIITEKLEDQTPDPQVMVARAAGDGATVSITGAGGQGVFPIERATRTLSGVIAAAGGITVEPEVAKITVIRGAHSGTIWLEDLYRDPRLDIALRDGDRILIEADTRAFIALGATGSQNRVVFDSRVITALEAIARVGGLNANTADPTGVFVFRNEPEAIANQVLARNDLVGAQRMVYVLDLTQPNGVFLARDFVIRDGDTVYVTEAPFVQWNKTVSALTGTLGTAASLASTANSLAGN